MMKKSLKTHTYRQYSVVVVVVVDVVMMKTNTR